ncbi:MAG TPA: single-stranded-DNA-specific exonuclease RecJ [Planctomycetota bacterium]|nr:single-stranded-DNA-specific exonuclease RecJ [Planctomycetota bacterium]
MRRGKRWVVPEIDLGLCERIQRSIACSPVVAALLVRRGVGEPDEAAAFLAPSLHDLSDPFLLPDMDRAVARIEEGLRRRERIAIFGDYDVDGIASTALLVSFFRQIDCPVDYRLPHRLSEGYGLREATVEELARDGIELLITVDNGSSSVGPIARARELGIDVVVTDHHEPPGELPSPVALVNPRLDEKSGVCRDLAGVGVTFKLVWALCQRLSKSKKLSPEFRQFLVDSLAFVALGTIADVVPLHGENRILARYGLTALGNSKRTGIRRLLDLALSSTRTNGAGRPEIESSHVGFRIAPRLNAVGRLGRADQGIELLLTDDPERADELCEAIETENQRRREIESAIHSQARERVLEEVDLSKARAIVLGDPEWHPGVIGIVAARIMDEFYRPTLLFALENGRARGSARSIPPVHITDALGRCRDVLLGFGGHAMAAGAEIEPRRIGELRDALQRSIEVPVETLEPEIEADGRVVLDEITADLFADVAKLAPHGHGNPEPLLVAEGVKLVGEPRLLGQDGRHIAFHVRQGERVLRAVAFGKGEWFDDLRGGRGLRLSLLFRVRKNVWQGRTTIELDVQDMKLAGAESVRREARAVESSKGAPANELA